MNLERVLIVEDDAIIRRGLVRISRGFVRKEVIFDEADSAQEGIKRIENAENSYDLVLSDGLEGGWRDIYDLIKGKSSETKMIVITGTLRFIQEARNLGLEAYEKPFKIETIKEIYQRFSEK